MPIIEINGQFKWDKSDKLHGTRKEAVAEAKDSYINTDRERQKKPKVKRRKKIPFTNRMMRRLG